MGQITLEAVRYAVKGGFKNAGDLERALSDYDVLFHNKTIEHGGKPYTFGRSGQLKEGVITGDFSDLLIDKYGIPQDGLREARIAVAKNHRTNQY